MKETTKKCSQARYARTIKKVAIFLVKSDSVRRTTKIVFLRSPKAESFGCTPCIGVYTMYTWRIKQECQGNKMPIEYRELEKEVIKLFLSIG